MAMIVRPKYLPVIILAALCWISPAAAEHRVAITIDDLPVISDYLRSESQLETIIFRLLAKIQRDNVPVTGFVNESSLYVNPDYVHGRTEWLQRWLTVTKSLGNHTYSHLDLNSVSPAEFETDITRGAVVIDRLMASIGGRPKYFRYPYLHMGKTPADRDRIEGFLARNGYQIAPVTINPGDTSFSAAYDLAELDGDQAAQDRIGQAYLRYFEQVIAISGDLSARIFQHDIPQILLIHSSALNARYFQDILAIFKAADYRFISLDEALSDPAYQGVDYGGQPTMPDQWRLQAIWASQSAPGVTIPPPLALPEGILMDQ